jgi:hypothetical protein
VQSAIWAVVQTTQFARTVTLSVAGGLKARDLHVWQSTADDEVEWRRR